MTYRKQRTGVQEGFTFMELVAAVFILGILATIAGLGYNAIIVRARVNKTKTNLQLVKSALNLVNMQYGRFPARLPDLVEKPKGDFPGWQPAFENEKLPKDGWDRDFYYKLTPGKKHPYELYSYGKEGPEGPVEEQISVWDI